MLLANIATTRPSAPEPPCEERDDWFDHDSADVAPILEEVELAEAIEIDETWFSKRHQPDYGTNRTPHPTTRDEADHCGVSDVTR